MNEEKKLIEEKLLKILEEAIIDEGASAARYKHATSLAQEPETRELLAKLVDDELDHERLLKERFYEIKKRLGLKVIKGG